MGLKGKNLCCVFFFFHWVYSIRDFHYLATPCRFRGEFLLLNLDANEPCASLPTGNSTTTNISTYLWYSIGRTIRRHPIDGRTTNDKRKISRLLGGKKRSRKAQTSRLSLLYTAIIGGTNTKEYLPSHEHTYPIINRPRRLQSVRTSHDERV